MNTKNINLILILIIISLVIFPTLFYVKKEHNANLWNVVYKSVVEAADRCKNESGCKEDTVTVGYLIERGYLDTVVNPITKEIISNDSYVDYSSNEFIIVN